MPDAVEHWRQHAACKGVDPELFYPKPGENGSALSQARAVCAVCPVKHQCLEYALAAGETMGIWGGTTERDRRRIRHERAKARGGR